MKNFKVLFKTSIIYIFPITAFILSLYAKETSLAARNALYLCLDVVIPSLFPFFVLSRLVMPYLSALACPKILKRFARGFFRLPYYTIIIIVIGYLSGYPTGAKMARDMLDEGLINSQQASRLIAVSNNCNPLFLIGTIGAGLFKSVKIGFFLLFIHWVSGFLAAVLSSPLSPSKDDSSNSPTKTTSIKRREPEKLSYLVPSAVEEAAILCIKVTGYIVLFAVLSELLSRLGIFSIISGVTGLFISKSANLDMPEFMSSLVRGVIEITSGSQAISHIGGTAINMRLAAISLICGFAGLSVHTQVIGIMKNTDVGYGHFFTVKLFHGLIAGLLTLVAIELFPMTIQVSTTALKPFFDFSGIRLVTIGVILLSLGVAPYRPSSRYPRMRKSKKRL